MSGRVRLEEFINYWLFGGLASYALGTVLWIYALSKASLSAVYPFAALTFVLVYFASIFILGESVSPRQFLGLTIVIIGLVIIIW